MAAITKNFKAHPKLILDVIKRQAGSLEKSILEGTMNAIEAGASRVDINLDTNGAEAGKPGAILKIIDDGKGIPSADEVDRFWATFGTPHSESEGKTWAEFRMGRGQLFSFGKNTWRTSTFQLIVDIRESEDPSYTGEGICFHMEDGLALFKGCEITVELFHNPIGHHVGSLDILRGSVKRQVEFMEVPVYFNGEQINTPASRVKKWTHVTDDAYFLFNAGKNLTIYNLGAYVMAQDAMTSGVTGVVVSRKKLKVNFARNDIQSDCDIWRRIQDVVRQNRVKKVRATARRLSAHERVAVLNDIASGKIDLSEVSGIGLFQTTSGNLLKLSDIRKNPLPWTFGENGSRVADRLMQFGQAVVLDEELLNLVNYSGKPERFFSWLMGRAGISEHEIERVWKPLERTHKDLDTIQNERGIDDTCVILPHDKTTKLERRLVRVLEDYNCWDGRRIIIGESNCYDAWTDGSSYIAIGRSYLNRLALSCYSGAADLVHTMWHEMAHDSPTAGTHNHGPEFYERFHELTDNSNALEIVGTLPGRMRKAVGREYQERMEQREKRAQAQRDKALGLDKLKPVVVVETEDEVELPIAAKVDKTPRPPTPRPPKLRRRIPAAALGDD